MRPNQPSRKTLQATPSTIRAKAAHKKSIHRRTDKQAKRLSVTPSVLDAFMIQTGLEIHYVELLPADFFYSREYTQD